MYNKSVIPKFMLVSVLSLLVTVCGASLLYAKQGKGEKEGQDFQIIDFKAEQSQNALAIEIAGNSIPDYTVSEKFNPFRVVLDITGCDLSENLGSVTLPQNNIAQMEVYDITTDTSCLKRFEFAVADTHDYKITPRGNTIEVAIIPTTHSSRTAATSSISDVKINFETQKTVITLLSNGPISRYKVDNISAKDNQPAKMFIDVKDVSVSELLREKYVGTSVERIRIAPRGTGARFVFDSDSTQLFSYSIKELSKGLQITIDEAAAQKEDALSPSKDSGDNNTIDDLIASSNTLLDEKEAQKKRVSPSGKDTFSFSGYNKQRISVDFYKIDVHNVFRLFRQITDLNIIVDESVSGTLTLALTDVPWDFALDIILNLLDLEKEERFNTLVIYPKQKDFSWPERAGDNLSFEADNEFAEQEALIIEQSANQPQEVLKAKELARKGHTAEKNGNFEEAAKLYEQAAGLWPENKRVYEKLSVLYLVNLGMNAKALHYARKGLKQNPKNYKAALYAAIASANMQRLAEASEFFHRAISNDPPMKEALFSFAAFNENIGQPESALKLLDKYYAYYGESQETMIAKARLLDKIGRTTAATKQYKAILSSGYQLRPDLKQYIKERLTTTPQ